MNRRALFLIAAAPIIFAAAAHAGDEKTPPAQDSSSSAPASNSSPAAPAVAPSAAPSVAPSPAPSAAPATMAKQSAPPTSETKPEAKPAAKPEIPLAAAPVPETKASPAAKTEEKPLSPCAAKLEPVADSYQRAHDDMVAWLSEASRKMEAGDAKIADLKKLIADNEARITQIKLEAAPKSETQARELDQRTRGLWTQLRVEESRQKDLCRALSSAAGRKVRELDASVLEQYEAISRAP